MIESIDKILNGQHQLMLMKGIVKSIEEKKTKDGNDIMLLQIVSDINDKSMRYNCLISEEIIKIKNRNIILSALDCEVYLIINVSNFLEKYYHKERKETFYTNKATFYIIDMQIGQKQEIKRSRPEYNF